MAGWYFASLRYILLNTQRKLVHSALKRRLKRKERLLAGEDEIEPETIEVKSAFDDVIEDELLPQQFLDPDVLRQYVVAWLEELRKLLKAEKTE